MTIFGVFSQSNRPTSKGSYAEQWKAVAELEQKSLPKSAADKVNAILERALNDKNSPQVIKALIHQGKYDLALDTRNDTTIFRNLNEMVARSGDPVERAVVHSMLGELYMQYYQKERWTIDQRTELGDFVPDDMKEWTRGILFTKVVEHLNASIAPAAELLDAKVESYAEVVILGKESRRFFPSMHDFLVRRAIEVFSGMESDEDLTRVLARKGIEVASLFAPTDKFIELPFDPLPSEYALWTLETYRKFLTSLQERDMQGSLLLMELDKLDYLSRLQGAHAMHALPSLERLSTEWEGEELSVEIIDKIADRYLYQIRQFSAQDSLPREQKAKELYELLEDGIQRYPNYERIAILENRLLQLTRPQFTVTGNKTFHPDGKIRLNVSFKNLQSLTAKLYRIDSPNDVEMARYGVRKNIDSKRRFIEDIPVHLTKHAPYVEGEAVLEVDVKEAGTYMLSFVSSPEVSPTYSPEYYFAVTRLAIFSRSSAQDRYDFFVVDRDTGEPVPNASIIVYKLPGNWRNSELTEVETIPVNDQGMAVYHKKIPNNDVFYHAVASGDNGSLLTRLPYTHWGYVDSESRERESVSIFTGRSLYRPGQVVHYKAIATRVNEKERRVVAAKNLEFTLRDANGREVSKQLLKSNEFGSMSGEFSLPTGILSGGFSIEAEGGSTHFQVEEYKRPTFEIAFDTIEQTYKFGEEVALNGKAESFSGIKLQNAIVEYRVSRRQMGWWPWGGTTDHFTEGVVRTDEKGRFEITFTPDKPDTHRSVRSIYSFVVEATVTDLNGETQTGTYTVSVGDVSMMLSLEMADRWEKSSGEKIVITAKNLDGNDVAAKGTYRVYSLQENDSIHQSVAEGSFEAGEQPGLREKLAALPSGKYRVKLESMDDRGNPVEAKKDVILFSYSDKRPPVKTNAWFVEKNTRFAPGKPAEVILGATGRVHVLYELWQENSLLERKWIKLNNENRLFSLPYKAAYSEAVTLMLTYVKEEQFYTHRSELRLEKENRELMVKLDVFRDRVRPGAEEEWRIRVTDANGNPAMAEVLASMYDFSLDKIYPSPAWSIPSFAIGRYYSRMGLSSDNSFYNEAARGIFPTPMERITPFEFDRFNWFDYSLYGRSQFFIRGTRSAQREEGAVMAFGSQKAESSLNIAVADARESDQVSEVVEERVASAAGGAVVLDQERGQEASQSPQLRRNFNETAFFYPSLRTNDKGETVIAFTVPESNTRWRFRVLAHDKELNSGTAEAFTVSQKELMVTPNMPRFLRQGDRSSISTKISNLSDSTINGYVTLEFFDPITEKALEVITMSDRTRSFSLAANQSSDASWMFNVPQELDLVGVRIIAQNEGFSDGEQHALAVLPNRMLVTESTRMDVKANETKTFTMERLTNRASATLRDYRLTLEFASNPAWYAVQTLPVLGEPTSDNAVAWFASYYANVMGNHIAKAYPKVTAMVEAWKKQGNDEEAFLSNLEKNQELKSILLEETPWVLDARNEAEQKQKLSLLFDLNRGSHLTRTAIDKLKELQLGQGGWSWFKGFRPNVAITHYILYGFQQLDELGAVTYTDEVGRMHAEAIAFIDAEAIRRFDALKRYNKEWKSIKTIPVTDLEYLFVRTGYREYSLDKEIGEIVDFYLSVIEKNWTNYGLYERSLIALLMEREGRKNTLQAILASFREHATLSVEMGMYWPNNRAGVFMSQSAVSVHTFIMDAFRVGGAGDEEMDEMKRWLLKQKQTQLWESTHATMDAVYALLSTGSDWFSSSGETVIQVGEHRLEPESRERGTGYIKESWEGTEIEPEMGSVTVSHEGTSPAWGALYWQYYEEMDKITKTDGSLDIEKQLFAEETTSSGIQLVRISDERPLKVGDRVVVRLTLRADRDLEFVHLKDTRAASFEPVDQVSGMGWQNGVPYYRTSKDASTNFYFDTLPKGTYIFEYRVHVNRVGDYSNGITTVQCMYAPEFTTHTEGMRIIVKE